MLHMPRRPPAQHSIADKPIVALLENKEHMQDVHLVHVKEDVSAAVSKPILDITSN